PRNRALLQSILGWATNAQGRIQSPYRVDIPSDGDFSAQMFVEKAVIPPDLRDCFHLDPKSRFYQKSIARIAFGEGKRHNPRTKFPRVRFGICVRQKLQEPMEGLGQG